MTDLINRLGASCYLAFEDGTNDYSAAQEAIDRIEELVKEKTALNHLCNAIFNRHIKEITVAEAKLTKAVEYFKKLDRRGDALETFDPVVHEIVTAALAELEGGEEATATAWRGRE